MKRVFILATSVLSLFCAAKADAATFRVEYLPRGYAVFSTFDRPEKCEINLYYNYTHDGLRKDGESLCFPKTVPEGKDVEFCKFTHDKFVDPKASKPPKISCKPLE